MTKAQLFKALADVPDGAAIYVRSVAQKAGPADGVLFTAHVAKRRSRTEWSVFERRSTAEAVMIIESGD